MMAGWASYNKFALLGAMRAVAQMVSYEVPALISIAVIVMLTNSMSIVSIIEAQSGLFISQVDVAGIPDLGLGWFIFSPVGLLGFICFFIAALAEGERTPFDIPEADSEIVAGYMTEYSGMKFALFFLAQYLLNFLLCAITVITFFGGWQGPGISWLWSMAVSEANPAGNPIFNVLAGILGTFYFLAKTYFFFFVMIWIRGAFPRLRVDQLMGFGWKFVIPLTIVNIFSASLWIGWIRWELNPDLAFLSALGEPYSFARWGFAFVATLVMNVAAYTLMTRINRSPDETIDELVADQVFGAVTLR